MYTTRMSLNSWYKVEDLTFKIGNLQAELDQIFQKANNMEDYKELRK